MPPSPASASNPTFCRRARMLDSSLEGGPRPLPTTPAAVPAASMPPKHSFAPPPLPPKPAPTTKRRLSSRTLPVNKNLRAISLSLVAKVRSRSAVTSTEIANELAQEAVAEIAAVNVPPADVQAVEKNIRRRLYDSLKVLVSVGAISRSPDSNKLLVWNGVSHLVPGPGHPAYDADLALKAGSASSPAANSCTSLRRSIKNAKEQISEKQELLGALQKQQKYLTALYERNSSRAEAHPMPSATGGSARISLPFVVVRTPPETEIELESSGDAHCMFFRFSESFQVVNDAGILERMFKPASEAFVAKAADEAASSLAAAASKSIPEGSSARAFAVEATEAAAEAATAAEAAAASLLALSPATPIRKRQSKMAKPRSKAERRLFPLPASSPPRLGQSGPNVRRTFAPPPPTWDPLQELDLDF